MMYAEALPIDNYQPNFKTYSITVEADSNQNSIEKFGKDFFMRVNFENAKDRANNRLFKLTGKKLSEEKLSLLDNLYSAYINTHILLDFYNDSIKTVFTLSLISSLSGFGNIFATTGGGPGYATMIPSMQIYNVAFGDGDFGYASSLGVLLMIVVVIITLVSRRFLKEDD